MRERGAREICVHSMFVQLRVGTVAGVYSAFCEQCSCKYRGVGACSMSVIGSKDYDGCSVERSEAQ